jgi:hypothetical protein
MTTNVSPAVRKTTIGALLAQLALLTAFAQGPLTPPAPPGPSMQTLDQIGAKTDQINTKADQVNTKVDQINSKAEKRIPITQASLPLTINAPGSYYAAENLTVAGGNAITINATGVSVELNGFTITSTASPASGDGIHLTDSARDVSISNGHIVGGITYNGTSFTGPGFSNAIRGPGAGSNSTSILVRDVTVSGCGSGILVFNNASTSVQHCAVSTVSGDGINAETVTDSSVFRSGGNGINATTAHNCSARNTISGYGIIAATATNTYGQSTSGTGLFATEATNCVGQSSSGTGLIAVNATNCLGATNSGGDGLVASYTASFSRGSNSGPGVGLDANIAIGCTGSAGSGGTTVVANNKYLMP